MDGDLFTFGKVMSGGLPAAAFGGRAEVMEQLAPLGPVYQAGTLSGNPVAVAAGLATLRAADDAVYAALDANADRLGRPARRRAVRSGVPHQVQRGREHAQRVLQPTTPVTDFAAARASADLALPAVLPRAARRAVSTRRRSAFEAWFVSAALDDDAFERIAAALPAAAGRPPRPRTPGAVTWPAHGSPKCT